ncbi:hypothetical protein ACQV5M_09405 [Leptospira sp. SA-E8]|uniref:hypothetical protein n=1 Tax=Leptospira sp. SA-E8 TaxID=3422259 RepID=UPI003EBCAFF6
MEQKKFFLIRNCKKEKRSLDEITYFEYLLVFLWKLISKQDIYCNLIVIIL